MKRILILLASLFLLSSSAWAAGTLKVTTPNGGEEWIVGKSYAVKWSKGNAGATVKIQLLKSGKHYKWVSKKTKNDGKHTWKIPTTVVTGSAYKIKITSTTKKTVTDSSNKNFKITKVTLKLTTPNSGQKWSTGKKYTIKWNKGNAGAKVKIQLLKNGKAYKWISKSTANDGKHAWKIPSDVATASTYKIKITSYYLDLKVITDTSNRTFTITSKPKVSLSCTPSSASEKGGKFTCTVSLSKSTTKSVKVKLAYSGTATAGTDYSGHHASRTIPKGKTSTKWKLTGKTDSKTKGNETIVINVTSVTNATEKGTQKASLVLTEKNSPIPIKVTSPNGGESWTAGKTYTIKWDKGDGGAYVNIQLFLFGKGSPSNSEWISKKTKNDGNHLWKIPTTVKAASAGYSIKISSKTKKSINDTSNKTFTITGLPPPPSTFELTSSAFGNNGNIPEKYSCDNGLLIDVSPPLAISGIPDGTKKMVILMNDDNVAWDHWGLYNIPPATTLICEGCVPSGTLQGKNSFGGTGYGGPCPPSDHSYTFTLYALDQASNLGAGATNSAVYDAIKNNIIEKTTLVGCYPNCP